MRSTLGWAIFLACSWTWCIGMFLPSLLVRDGGEPFFWAFFIPNVIGAASVGWLLRTADRSRSLVALLAPIVLLFSAVTIGFHAYWIVWQGGVQIGKGNPAMPGGIVAGAAVVLALVAVRRRVDWLPAVVTLLFSLTLGALLLTAPASAPAGVFGPELAGMVMVTTLGFGLCPYLDITFNRAVQRAGNPRAAFSAGFFVFFALIILVATRGRVVWSPLEPLFAVPGWVLSAAVGCHFGAQAAFTVAAHAAALRDVPGHSCRQGGRCTGSPCPIRYVALPLGAGAVLAMALYLSTVRIESPGLAPIDAHELVYRGFLACYGLIFPAWMLLSIGGRDPLSRRTLTVLVLTCLLATPFYWMGMVERREVWLIPGVLLVLGSMLLADRPKVGPRVQPTKH